MSVQAMSQTVDPSQTPATLDPDTQIPAQEAAPAGYQRMRCTFRSNGSFAGYLASSKNAYLWLTQNPDEAAWVKWYIDGNGKWWLRKSTSPGDRYLGRAEYYYADWGLSQDTHSSYYAKPVVYNGDHTISLAADSTKSLYGPYGNKWVCWGEDPNILVCNLE